MGGKSIPRQSVNASGFVFDRMMELEGTRGYGGMESDDITDCKKGRGTGDWGKEDVPEARSFSIRLGKA